MRKAKIVIASGVLALTLVGCSSAVPREAAAENSPPVLTPEPAQIIVQQDEKPIVAEPIATQVKDFVPSEDDVLAAREKVLEGMTDDQIERLNLVIKEANLWWEHEYLYFNIFGVLEDPEALYWNCFDKMGEIQIGWAVDGGLDMEAVCAEEGLTENEFYAKYGTPVVSDNKYDADDFTAILDELIATVQNENLKTDLQYIRDEAQLAKDNHSMEHANNEYKALHDMDYFLLRYGPTDVGPYVKDDSTITKYYGTLSIYD